MSCFLNGTITQQLTIPDQQPKIFWMRFKHEMVCQLPVITYNTLKTNVTACSELKTTDYINTQQQAGTTNTPQWSTSATNRGFRNRLGTEEPAYTFIITTNVLITKFFLFFLHFCSTHLRPHLTDHEQPVTRQEVYSTYIRIYHTSWNHDCESLLYLMAWQTIVLATKHKFTVAIYLHISNFLCTMSFTTFSYSTILQGFWIMQGL